MLSRRCEVGPGGRTVGVDIDARGCRRRRRVGIDAALGGRERRRTRSRVDTQICR